MENPRIVVRPWRPADMDAIVAIEKNSFRRHAWPRELLLECAQECAGAALVALVDGRVAGYSMAAVRADRGDLVSLAVNPAERRLGVAKVLIASTLRRLKRRGVRRLSLMVKVTNRPALRLYGGFEFLRVRRVARYYEDGRDGYLMARDL